MAKLTGPLMSLGASQSIGKTLVFSRWRGIQYARQHVIPSNPQSAAQTNTRNIWKTLSDIYTRAPAIMQEPWDASAFGQPLTSRNRFFQINAPLLDGTVLLTTALWGVVARAGLPPLTCTSSDATGQILRLTLTTPTPPSGWSIVAAQGVAVLQGDPTDPIVRQPIAAEDTSDPFTQVNIDVDVAGTYVWSGWLKWLRPDGLNAYSSPFSGTQAIA